MKNAPSLFAILCILAWPAFAAIRVESPAGITAEVDTQSGAYAITGQPQGWTFGGSLGAATQSAEVVRGSDLAGAFQEIRFRWNPGRPLSGSIRIYDGRPAALFTLTSESAAAQPPSPWPLFTAIPSGLHHFSYKDQVFSPPSFELEQTGTPWLLFDDKARAVILSPANQFMTARMVGDGEHELACGLNEGVADLPAGFAQQTLMVFGAGINAAWDEWGRTLTDLGGKARPANDSDIGLRTLGYWTDNGAYYYYNYDPSLGYEGTLVDLARHYRDRAIPIRYLQLDSWWYYKSLTDPNGKAVKTKKTSLPAGEWNRYGGLLAYDAHPAVLPSGLAGAQKRIGLPFITHNRWIDPASTYRAKYRISGYAAVDPRWWDRIIGSIADGGVVCYEQDWLNIIYNHSPELRTKPGVGEAFTDNMARAAAQRGLSVQYCMALPRYFLQGSRYSNLTTVRTSDDRFMLPRWEPFLYTSRLASAIGAWPWTDVFMSTETDNLMVATLSAGMVGVGDAIGSENRENLLRSARADGVLVKPDVPLLPIDSVYVGDANESEKPPMIAATHTDHGARRTCYVFAFDRDTDSVHAEFKPSELGLSGQVLVFEMRSGTARKQPAESPCSYELPPGSTEFCEIAPFGVSGIAFFGDSGKFVSSGHKRIAAIDEKPGSLAATVIFAAGEKSVRLFGYAASAPRAIARGGAVGPVAYDSPTGRFEADVSPAAGVAAEAPGGDPVRQAEIEFALGK
jgi:hypothetical protein